MSIEYEHVCQLLLKIYIFWKWILCVFCRNVLNYHKKHTIHTEYNQTFVFWFMSGKMHINKAMFDWDFKNCSPSLSEGKVSARPCYLQNQTESERNFDPNPKTHFKGNNATWIINCIGNIFLAFKQRFSCASTRSLQFKEILCLLI